MFWNFLLPEGAVWLAGQVSLGLPLLWLSVLVLALLVEGATAEMVSIWFAPGAFVTMILSFFVDSVVIQVVTFAALSALLLILAKTVFKKRLTGRGRISLTNADALVGQAAMVEEAIDNQREQGVVKINGQLWTARCEKDEDKPEKGQHVRIVRIAGSKLICAPVTQTCAGGDRATSAGRSL
jgi:membrane protein implicated in regulation of membrane protease activity